MDPEDTTSGAISGPGSDQSLFPSQPGYAQIRARHRPSPKGEQRLWLYQCAVKSCSKGEMKIAGTSRPKGRDVPSCRFCGGKMHWKGTERDPSTPSYILTGGTTTLIGTPMTNVNAIATTNGVGASGSTGLLGPHGEDSGNGQGHGYRRSLSPQPPKSSHSYTSQSGFSAAGQHANHQGRAVSPSAGSSAGDTTMMDQSRLTPGHTSSSANTQQTRSASPSSQSAEQRHSRPWEL